MENLSHFASWKDSFISRHNGPTDAAIEKMLSTLNLKSLEDLVSKTVPERIRFKSDLKLEEPLDERKALEELKLIFSANKVYRSYMGMGYHDVVLPPVIQRNIFENPGWYTQYTPYQSEIAQGRLEALINFQTLVSELTGLPITNASLLDEGTAAAEAMGLAWSVKNRDAATSFFVDEAVHPQTLSVLRTRAEPLGIRITVGVPEKFSFSEKIFAALVQYPGSGGEVKDPTSFIAKVHENNALAIVAADPMALVLLKNPAELGADIAVGSMQRFGVPMGYGGPHAAYFATKDEYKRVVPGRIIGVSKDAQGKQGYRLALQTREQHIRREKATSNICTAQVLLAIISSMYAVYHGPKGLRSIALRIHSLTCALSDGLKQAGIKVEGNSFFDTLALSLDEKRVQEIRTRAETKKMNFRYLGATQVGVTLDETTRISDLSDLYFALTGKTLSEKEISALVSGVKSPLASSVLRSKDFLKQKIFNQHHSETELLRYIRKLERRDLSLTQSMIPLGSCTMKLNAAAELYPVTWSETGGIHPFAPKEQVGGYLKMTNQLENWLSEITGFQATSLQPNAGSQGEYAGLLVIRHYHQSRKEGHRQICLIPKSAHGTNPASAVMAGMQVVVVECDDQGNVDVEDLRRKAKEHSTNLSALMITYPSTHGVYEASIKEICEIIHSNGGQVYLDGANMNAQVGLCRPGDFGADVCHLNLHKTFCIPHGGGGPGMGPICVQSHLAPFLPSHPVISVNENSKAMGAISAAPFGSASILVISWMYIRMMGAKGLKRATELAILNANYMAKRLEADYPVVYRGANGRVAHECIIDLRGLKATSGVEVEDVAKRLMDYGFHAPTVSWPVAGTMMIEPTESESLEELDRYCDAMIAIRKEVAEIENGKADRVNNVLKHAPHAADVVLSDSWDRPYSREKAAFPLVWVKESKFWPAVSRIDNVYGDRNLVCTCDPTDSYS